MPTNFAVKKIVHMIKWKFSRNYVDTAAHFAKTHNSYRHKTRAFKNHTIFYL